MEAVKRRTRVDSQFTQQDTAGVLVDVQRVGLTARPVEREHQLFPQALAKGVLPD